MKTSANLITKISICRKSYKPVCYTIIGKLTFWVCWSSSLGSHPLNPGRIKAVISATLEGKNTLVIQSTGAGKSLRFQLPCIANKTLTAVLMPTIDLIKDQYQHLEATGLHTAFLGTLQTDKSILKRIV